tara:strand:- start:81 stop:2276 length:2196 start_codon:yes stop_codon:yes gene_type:complete
MELVERHNLDRINFLNDMDFDTFKQFVKGKNNEEKKTKFDILKSFCNNNIKARGEIRRLYSYTHNTPLEVGGRLYCGSSVQGLQKDFRGFLLNGITTDIDMKNAHPVILKYICSLHNIHCPNLSYYIENRDTILTEFGENGKTDFLKAVNDDKINRKVQHTFFKDFDKECKKIQKEVTALECYKNIVESVPSTRIYNWLGSAINRILCVYENNILQEVISVIYSKNIEMCALMFDGLMIYGNHYENNELLNEITQNVNAKFEGLDMVFTYKDHSTNIKIPDGYQTKAKMEEITDTFENVAKVFEQTHCKINNKSFFIKETPEKIIIMSKTQLITTYEHMIYRIVKEDKIITCNFISDWLRNNKNIRNYDDIECYPDVSLCPKNIFNTWRPFAMELVKEYEPNIDALNMFRNHIKILCGNDENVAHYLECWIAQMIQFPSVKTICPTIISNQGAGKGTLLKLIAAMIGEDKYFETTSPSRDVWGDFNGRMANTFLVNLDELSRKESMECDGKIKGLITNPRMTINEKGLKQYSIISYHRFMGTTNHKDPMKTEKDDRRNLFTRASDELIGNIDYFNKINEYINDINAIKTFYEYFKSIPDMINFNKMKIPVTEYQQDLKEANVSPIELWVKSFVLDNYYETEIEKYSKDLFVLFNEWCKKCNIEYKVNNIQFGVRMKHLNIPGIEKGKHTNKGDKKVFKIQILRNYFDLNNIADIDLTKDEDTDMELDDNGI